MHQFGVPVHCTHFAGAFAISYGFEQGSGPIVMDEVRCRGSETTLMDCPLSLNHSCGHHQDAGVQCTLSTYGEVSLNYMIACMLGQ